MHCHNCGKSIDESAAVCQYCGTATTPGSGGGSSLPLRELVGAFAALSVAYPVLLMAVVAPASRQFAHLPLTGGFAAVWAIALLGVALDQWWYRLVAAVGFVGVGLTNLYYAVDPYLRLGLLEGAVINDPASGILFRSLHWLLDQVGMLADLGQALFTLESVLLVVLALLYVGVAAMLVSTMDRAA